ncbi:archaellin/type IV pilin N-terminal domain-containing protein [Cuniculiplasma sp. SKW3]|uniref:archaellin/type IV pilin N-terminal domain-containing protein n=1 Tax=unclassified Cuniculiplasma TaxID=2619706 RepID=UPI003FD05579
MKRVYNEDSAVSPIIATILLIGITVILAATLIAILSTFNNSTHFHDIDTSEYMEGPFNLSNGNEYFLNITSTSQIVPLGQITIEIFNGSKVLYEGNLLNKTTGNIKIVDQVNAQFSPANSVEIMLSGKENRITSSDLIYDSTLFATVTPS